MLVLSILILLFTLHKIHKDYLAFLALGPGGIPSTPKGYLCLCFLRPFALRDPFAPPSITPTLYPQTGFLYSSKEKIPKRFTRPRVTGIAPQRQISHHSPGYIHALLTAELTRLVRKHSHTHGLYTDTSCFEKHSTGIFVAGPFCSPTTSTTTSTSTCNSEVCHAHPSDGSLHLTLHPADVAVVLERGWGQRHPLAREGSWWWRALRSGKKTVPAGFVMVYAPRDEGELGGVLEIVRAAVGWVSGRSCES